MADTHMLCVKVPSDVRENLRRWAKSNITNMTAELIRSARERAEREAKQRPRGEALSAA
jgi:hypothetical protein